MYKNQADWLIEKNPSNNHITNYTLTMPGGEG